MVEYLGDGSAKWTPPAVGSILLPVRHRVGSLETTRTGDGAPALRGVSYRVLDGTKDRRFGDELPGGVRHHNDV
jgi:hypothetical protein